MLVGRQIVDRAKIQRIIFEFDYYEKAFHQFYDTYRVVPGNLDYKTCLKHSIFSGCLCMTDANKDCTDHNCSAANTFEHQQFCQRAFRSNSAGGIGGKVVNSVYDYSLGVMPTLKWAGYIDKEVLPYNIIDNSFVVWLPGRENIYYGRFANASFDNNIGIYIAGFKKHAQYSITDEKYGFIQRLWFLSTNNLRQKEFYNINYSKLLDNHNAIAMFGYERDFSGKAHRGAGEADSIQSEYGVFSAKIASQLDAKIDDGRPGSGTLLAMKGQYATKPSSTEDQIKATCYDKDFSEVEKAIYNTSNDRKHSCNVLKIMSDIK